MHKPVALLLLLLAAACRSASPDGGGPSKRDSDRAGAAVAHPMCECNDGGRVPHTHHDPNETFTSFACSVPHASIPGKPADAQDFTRAGGECRCFETKGMCKCLHCLGEKGAKCYCEQGEPRCLCGLDMGGCRCTHCAGRDGTGVCPCDHSKTRAKLEAQKKPKPPAR